MANNIATGRKSIISGLGAAFKIGFVASCVAIAIGFLIPTALSSLGHKSCQSDYAKEGLTGCFEVPPFVGFVQFTLGIVGMFFAPLWLGLMFALIWAAKKTWTFWATFIDMLVASVMMLLTFIVFEVLWYQPWVSIPYNRFELNRIYTTPFGVLVLFGAMFGFLMTIVFTKRLWRSFEPLGFLPQKKEE